MRLRIKVFITIAIMIISIILSTQIRSSIQNSLLICAEILIPSLFPFFIISGILIDLKLDTIIPPPLCSFFLGLICGYPIGTKTVCHYYQNNLLNHTQAQMLLLCTANASPAFVILALGETILKNKSLGMILFLCQSINSLVIFLLFVPKKHRKPDSTFPEKRMTDTLFLNVKQSVDQILFVCGVTIVFGICCDLILPLLNTNIAKWIGLIEILHGNSFFKQDDLILIATVLGFSGLCIWVQCIFFIQQTNLKISYLILGKIHAAITLPQYVSILISSSYSQKIISLFIIILTNILLACIIKVKGCDYKHDFFKKHREMLRLLRARNKNSIQRTGSLPTQRNRGCRIFLPKIPVHTTQAYSATAGTANKAIQQR